MKKSRKAPKVSFTFFQCCSRRSLCAKAWCCARSRRTRRCRCWPAWAAGQRGSAGRRRPGALCRAAACIPFPACPPPLWAGPGNQMPGQLFVNGLAPETIKKNTRNSPMFLKCIFLITYFLSAQLRIRFSWSPNLSEHFDRRTDACTEMPGTRKCDDMTREFLYRWSESRLTETQVVITTADERLHQTRWDTLHTSFHSPLTLRRTFPVTQAWKRLAPNFRGLWTLWCLLSAPQKEQWTHLEALEDSRSLTWKTATKEGWMEAEKYKEPHQPLGSAVEVCSLPGSQWSHL